MPVRTAELVDQTNRFLDLLEAGNQAGMADMLDDQVVWSAPMSAGPTEDSEPARGREAFGSRLGSISELMRSARFTRYSARTKRSIHYDHRVGGSGPDLVAAKISANVRFCRASC